LPTINEELPLPQTVEEKPLSLQESAIFLAEQYRLLVAPGQVVELRAVDVKHGGGRPHVEAGFFDSDHLVNCAGCCAPSLLRRLESTRRRYVEWPDGSMLKCASEAGSKSAAEA
jgi:hypothetical protein